MLDVLRSLDLSSPLLAQDSGLFDLNQGLKEDAKGGKEDEEEFPRSVDGLALTPHAPSTLPTQPPKQEEQAQKKEEEKEEEKEEVVMVVEDGGLGAKEEDKEEEEILDSPSKCVKCM